MSRARISIENSSSVHFVTLTVSNWHYVFDRHGRWQILADSLRFLQDNRGLRLRAYVFMLNHLHMIVNAPDTAACLRDFKRHTAHEIRRNMEQKERGLVKLFMDTDGAFRLWKPDNKPRIIETERFFLQKLNYIHFNPVRKGYVAHPEYWLWSSANPLSPLKTEPVW
jgi:REP element-mobilizing transposase RayT